MTSTGASCIQNGYNIVQDWVNQLLELDGKLVESTPRRNKWNNSQKLRRMYHATVGKASTDRQSKKFSSTDDRFLWTVGICALNSLSTAGTEKDLISTEILD